MPYLLTINHSVMGQTNYFSFRFICFLILFPAVFCNAQTISNSRKTSYYTYIYKISSEDVKAKYSNLKIPFSSFCKTPVDSFPTDDGLEKNLEQGYYIFMHVHGPDVNYQLKSYNDLQLKVVNISHKYNSLIVYHRDGTIYHNAEVYINKKRIPFHAATQSYNFSTRKEEMLVRVKLGEDFFYYELEDLNYIDYEDKWEKIYTNNFYKNSIYAFRFSKRQLFRLGALFTGKNREYYYGYMAFNKPKYLPGDTVKMKAFIVHSSGRPIRKKLSLTFSKSYYDTDAKLLAQLKPSGKGNYVYEFVLPDSLPTGKYYSLHLKKGGKTFLENSINLEDYELEKTKYEFRVEKDEYRVGEPVQFFLKGTDANGLPLLDAQVELTATPRAVTKFEDAPLFVPDTLWHLEQNLDNLGETKLIFPDSLLPQANMGINVTAIFKNGDNEIHNITKTFELIHPQQKIITRADSGYIQAIYFENNKQKEKEGIVFMLNDEGDIFSKKTIQFPFKERINPLTKKYRFQCGSQDESKEITSYSNDVHFYGYKTADTLYIQLENPNKARVNYMLFHNKKKIAEGCTDSLSLKIPSRSNSPYRIVYDFIWGGKVISEETPIFTYKKNLNVIIDQPNTVYPGQNVNVKIKVTNYKNKPVKNVNLTASAINSQFQNMHIPTVPYLGKGKKTYLFRKHDQYRYPNYEEPYLGEVDYGSNLPLSASLIKKTGLDSILYYKFFWPKTGSYYHYDSILSTNAQFSPFIVRYGTIVQPWLIYLDGRLVYTAESKENRKFAFIGSPGYHTIGIRTAASEYVVDSVLLKKGWKLDFSIDETNLPKNIKAKTASPFYTEEEVKLLRSSILLLKNNYQNQTAFLRQGDNIWALNSQNWGTTEIGPFTDAPIHFKIINGYSTTFIFEPDHALLLSDTTIKLTPTKINYKLPNNNPSIFPGDTALTKNNIQKDYVFRPSKVNVFFRDPPVEEGGSRYNFTYQSDSTVYAIKFFKPENIAQSIFYKGSTTLFSHLNPGYYSLMLITENGYCYRKDSIKIRANGTLYENLKHIEFNYYKLDLASKEKQIAPTSSGKLFNQNNFYTAYGFAGSLAGSISDRNETIPFASVLLLKNNEVIATTVSDINGNYSFPSLRSGKYTLLISYIGYETSETKNVVIGNAKLELNVSLKIDSKSLNETVVVTALGVTRNVKSMGYSTSVVNQMSGKVAGVSITNAGTPGMKLPNRTSIFNTRFNPEEYANAKQLRNRFSDYAYWQPRLTTDKNGEAFFTATFPDNITGWNSFALAMDGKKNSGTGYTTTRSFKKVVATLAVPRFLITGDEAFVIGKSLNYTTDSLKIKTQFKINGNLKPEKEIKLSSASIEKSGLTAGNANDSIPVSYTLATSGYKDGEEHKIPVYPIGVEETEGMFAVLKKDTSLTVSLSANKGTYEIYAEDNALQMMLGELKKLEDYAYYCNEQKASKLKGLLMEKKIREHLGESFEKRKEKTITQLIQKLEKSQKPKGYWGWWDESPYNAWMTAYVSLSLYKAQQAGYVINTLPAAIAFLKEELDVLKGDDLLYVLSVLSEMKEPVSYASCISRLKNTPLSLYEQLSLIKIRQEQHFAYDSTLLTKQIKSDVFGNLYVGKESTQWYDNSIQLTLLGYRIAANDTKLSHYKDGFTGYFLHQKRNGGWRNTMETASILETILPDLLQANGNKLKPAEIHIQGAQVDLTSKQFPYHTIIPSTESALKINKTGTSPVYFTTYTTYWNPHPEKVDGAFEVDTHFEVNSKRVETLKAGEQASLIVNVNVIKEAEYIMIEVPIPAGCSYMPRNNYRYYYYGVESNREYLKNKTLIFCQRLTAGAHQFSIELQPRFTGNYTLNPAKVEMMYFPTFYGRDNLKKTVIKE